MLSDANRLQGRVDDTSLSDSSFRPSHIASGCTGTGCKPQNWFSSCCDAAKGTCHLFHLQTLYIHLNLAEEDSTNDLCFVAQTAMTLLKVAHRYCQ